MYLFQATGIALTYIIVLIQFYLNQDLIDKYRDAFTIAISRNATYKIK